LPHRTLLLLAALALAGGVARGQEPPPAEPPASPAAPGQDEEEDDPSLYAGWATPQEPEPPPRPKITLLFTGGAYYSNVGLYIPLNGASADSSGERSEAEIYRALLGGALSRQFLVLEASVNPLPCLGVAVHEWMWAYQKAQVTKDFNLVAALTAGFDEPFALSAFLGNVVDFQVMGGGGQRGRGYLGLVVSGGGGHIKQNELIKDAWLETEAKLKGDRVSDEMKLSWSFRVGAKLHDNSEITDTAYVALRRSRVDSEGGHWLLANSGIEYRFDLSLRGKPVRQLLTVDKKFPLGKGKVVLVLGVGLLWESRAVYTGALAETHAPGLQFLIRPNVVF
jgi:hypothetical protein